MPCSKDEAEALSADDLFLTSSDTIPTIVARNDGDGWAIDVYCEAKPQSAFLNEIAKLAPSGNQKPHVEKLADQDWATLSQQGLEPLLAGRFYVHTSNDLPTTDTGLSNLCIDASQAFGTGHHETTRGCLKTLDRLKRQGKTFRNIIDVGTGTGVLALAAHHLWPSAHIVASDIDPIAVNVSRDNLKENGVDVRTQAGTIQVLQSNGMDNPSISRRAPYDLIIANILAGPLRSLAEQFASATRPGTVMLVAGLLAEQQDDLLATYRRHGFRLQSIQMELEWPCLTLIKRPKFGWQRKRATKSPLAEDYFGEC